MATSQVNEAIEPATDADDPDPTETMEVELSELNVFDPGEIDPDEEVNLEMEEMEGEIPEADFVPDGFETPTDDGEAVPDDDSAGDVADTPTEAVQVDTSVRFSDEDKVDMILVPKSEIEAYRSHHGVLNNLCIEVAKSDVRIEYLKAEMKEEKAYRDKLLIDVRNQVRDFTIGQKRLDFEAGEPVGVDVADDPTDDTNLPRDENGDVIDVDDQTPTEDDQSVQHEDPAKSASLSELIKFGLTEKQCELWQSADLDTIADYEKAINQDRLGKIVKETSGLGGKAIDRIADAYIGWRAENPIPNE